jgi:hypothetical protein
MNQQTQSHHTYVRMVLRQHTPLNLESFLLQHQSILVPPKSAVRGGKIVHCDAYKRTRQIIRQMNQQTQSHHTYTRIVLRQHTPLKLERFFIQNQSILVPPKSVVREGKIAHCVAYKRTRQTTRQKINKHNHITPMSGWFSGSTRR